MLRALVDAGYKVTVLTRSKKPGVFGDDVRVVEVDFTSPDSLTAALQGIDGFVSTVGHTGIESQTVMIDAAIAAGVQRFIPSEYGSCTTDPRLKTLPFYSDIYKARHHLQEKAEVRKITWSVLACGAFLEYFLDCGLLLDWVKNQATWYDEGDNRFSATSQVNIGKAIAGIFKNPEATKNRVVRVSETILTQNKLLEIAQDLRPDIRWAISKVKTDVLLKEGLDEFYGGNHSMPVLLKILGGTALAGDTYGAAFDENDNELLGIQELREVDLKGLVSKNLV